MTIKLGTIAADALTGSALADYLNGDLGNDIFTGSSGFDVFEGWYGNETVNGGSSSFAFNGGEGLDTANLAAGDWSFSFSGWQGHGSLQLTNYATGQAVSLADTETIKVGTATYKMTVTADKATSFTGTSVSDFVLARDGADVLNTLGGDDWIIGGGGADRINAGIGNDIIDKSGFANNGTAPQVSTLVADSGDDMIIGALNTMQHNTRYSIDGGIGNDTFHVTDAFPNGVSTSPFTLSYANGKTTLTYQYLDMTTFQLKSFVGATLTGVEQIVDDFSGKVFTFNGTKWIEGRPTVTTATATALSEKVTGGAGNDVLNGKGGFDQFVGGAGTDTVQLSGRVEQWTASSFNAIDPVTKLVTLTNFSDPRNSGALLGADIEKISFANGSGVDQVYNFKMTTTGVIAGATTGNDFLVASGTLTANQSVALNSGNDVLFGSGNLTKIDAGAGDDIVTWFENGTGTSGISVLGGIGNDKISVAGAVATGTWTIDGGTGNDSISYSGSAVATLTGGDGDDTLFGASNSKMYGGIGNDSFSLFFTQGQTGGVVDGDAGEDLLGLFETSGEVIVTKSGTNFLVTDKATGAVVTVTEMEAIRFGDRAIDLRQGFTTTVGTTGADSKVGGTGIDLMHGGAGNDVLNGGAGNDSLAGDAGNDTLLGGIGNDFFFGGAGNDIMTGGAGFDLFHFRSSSDMFEGKDTIMDFAAGVGLGDVLAFSSDADVDSFEDMIAHGAQVGANTVFTFDNGDTLTLRNVTLTSMVSDDFLFL